MDKRTQIAALIAIVLLLFLGRKTIVQLIERLCGYDLMDGDVEIIDLPETKITEGKKLSPPFSKQTTGLMCHCDGAAYVGPVLVRKYDIPSAPLPRYIWQAANPVNYPLRPLTVPVLPSLAGVSSDGNLPKANADGTFSTTTAKTGGMIMWSRG